MSLTGPLLPWVFIVIAVGSFVALVMGVPGSSKRWVRRLWRAGLAIILNIAVLLYAGVTLNKQYEFYSSWDDLLGAATKQTTTDHGGRALNAFKTSTSGPGLHALSRPVSFPMPPKPGTRMQTYYVTGKLTHTRAEVLAYLPKGYDPKDMSKKYPVIMALHGFPGGPHLYFHLNNFFDHVDTAVDTKKMNEAIVIVPTINSPRTLDTECVNVPGGPQTETWLSKDIPDWIVNTFPVKTDRASWATYGFSFGGWCAAMLTLRHPDIFGAGVVIQGYFRPQFDPSYVPFRPGSALYREYDLIALSRKKPPPVALWVLASAQDAVSYPTSRQFAHDARAPMSVTSVLLASGGHRTAVWFPKMDETFAWLGRSVPGFIPPKPPGASPSVLPPVKASPIAKPAR